MTAEPWVSMGQIAEHLCFTSVRSTVGSTAKACPRIAWGGGGSSSFPRWVNGCARVVRTTTRGIGPQKYDVLHGRNRVSMEGQLHDQKSLQSVTGKTTDWNEIAKDCIAFANATGGRLLLGIADGQDASPASQQIGVMNRLSDNQHLIADCWVIKNGRYACSATINQRLI